MTKKERQAASDHRVADHIAKYGCHVYCVVDPQNQSPTFTYSVGIQHTTGQPEAIVIGLSTELGHFMINEYLAKLRKGVRFRRGWKYKGFLEGYPVYMEPAKRVMLKEYTFGCDRYYAGKPYSVVQLVYPNTMGVWPWEKEAHQSFRDIQPMLGRKRTDRP